MTESVDSSSTLFIHGLPKEATNRDVISTFNQFGPIRRCHIIKENGISKGLGYITFVIKEDAEKALNSSVELGGKPLRLKLEKDSDKQTSLFFIDKKPISKTKLREKTKEIAKKTRARIIIRNLSFKIDENSLKETFSKFGTITDVNIPKKEDGSVRGFAFVSFSSRNMAAKAIKEMNGKKILNRVVALDYSLPKKEYQNISQNQTNSTNDDDKELQSEASSDDDDQNDNENSGNEEESDDDKIKNVDSESNTDDEEIEHDNSDEDENDDNHSVSTDASSTRQKERKRKSRDAREGKTIFVKSLSFDTDVDGLKAFMEQFGTVQYCVLCEDDFGRPRGTGFVKFKEKEHADACLEEFDKNANKFFLDGRRFEACLAVTRGKAFDLAHKKKLKARDKRNIYLAKEGLIYPDSPAAEDVSQSDLTKRLQLEMRKRIMLNNLLNFVSRNRLCIHNIPESYNDKKLKKLCLSVLDNPNAVITEAKVMRNVKKSGLGKPAGFGFVTFKRHADALLCLRRLNNNPEVFTISKRPIVEFSIEKISAIKKKRKNNDLHYEEDDKDVEIDIPDEDLPHMGVKAKPFKEDEKIILPKVNRKIYENIQKLKERGKKIRQEAKRFKAMKKNKKSKSYRTTKSQI